MLALGKRISLILTALLVLTASGCGSPDSKFELFVDDFKSSYGEAVTDGDELLSVTHRFEKIDGILAILTYTVKRTDETGHSADVKTQVTYQFQDGKWRFVRSFPLQEGELRDTNRRRNKAEAVSTFLSAASNY